MQPVIMPSCGNNAWAMRPRAKPGIAGGSAISHDTPPGTCSEPPAANRMSPDLRKRRNAVARSKQSGKESSTMMAPGFNSATAITFGTLVAPTKTSASYASNGSGPVVVRIRTSPRKPNAALASWASRCSSPRLATTSHSVMCSG